MSLKKALGILISVLIIICFASAQAATHFALNVDVMGQGESFDKLSPSLKLEKSDDENIILARGNKSKKSKKNKKSKKSEKSEKSVKSKKSEKSEKSKKSEKSEKSKKSEKSVKSKKSKKSKKKIKN